MDNFNVPKKVNRHVLKALNVLSGGNFKEGITTGRIFHQVKYQMRNLVPVPFVEEVIQKSLKNLSEIGLIEKHGTRFCMGRNYSAGPAGNANQGGPPDKRIFRNIEKQRSKSGLNPNLKRNCCSEDSISGDDFDKTRKRMRSNNKQLKYTGRTTLLPRARQHRCRMSSSFNAPSFEGVSNSEEKYIEAEVNNTKSTGFDSLSLATVTPTPSLEITETDGEIKKTKGVKVMVEKLTEEKIAALVSSGKSQTDMETTVSESSKEKDNASSSDIASKKSHQSGNDSAENSSKQNVKVQQSAATDKDEASMSYVN